MSDAALHRRSPGFFKNLIIAYYKFISDRRRYMRAPLRLKVTNKRSTLFEFYSSTNISVGGMFIKADSPYAVGSRLELEFSFPGREGTFHAEGKVIRVVHLDPDSNPEDFDPGMGVQFTNLSQEARDAIDAFINEIK
jgi:type IV pilus assembly protein PilZ